MDQNGYYGQVVVLNRYNRKRSHDELDDGDECLPISKRINSLHIEGQVHATGHQQVLISNQMNPFHGISEDVASTSSPNATRTGQGLYAQHLSSRCLDLANQLPVTNRIPNLYEYVSICDGCSDVRYSAMNFSHELPDSDIQMASGQMIHSSPDTPSSLAGQFGLYHQTLPHNHLAPSHNPTLQTFPNHLHSSSMPQVSMDLMGHTNSHGATYPLNGLVISNKCDTFDEQQIPQGPYEPELGISENPHYFAANRLLYEAHLSRVQRTSSF